jgi:hypothetical protein
MAEKIEQAMAKPVAPKRGVDLMDRDLSFWAKKVQAGATKRYTEEITITPEIARRILELNDNNRPVSAAYVEELANDIKHKRWAVNGETIIISKDGYLNDGQHRLMAIIAAGIPSTCLVVFGVDRDTRFTVDGGRIRRASTLMSMKAVGNATECASVAGIIASYKPGAPIVRVSRADIMEAFARYDRVISGQVARIIVSSNRRNFGRGNLVAISAAMVVLSEVKDKEAVEKFLYSLISGANIERDDPILSLRDRLKSMKPHQRGTGRMELILRHWNLYARNGKIKKRGIRTSGVWPKAILEPGIYGPEVLDADE